MKALIFVIIAYLELKVVGIQKLIALRLIVQKIDFGLDRGLRHEIIKYEFLYLQYVSAHNWSNVSSFSFEFFLPILVICVEVVF